MIPLLLLHGALGSASQFDDLKDILKHQCDVHAFDFSGHGVDSYRGALSMDLFANDILNYLIHNGIEKCNIFGYSMGGYAAVTLALKHPDRIISIITLGTKWRWDPDIAAKETKMLNADTISEKIPSFAEMLRYRHVGQGWRPLLKRTSELMTELGNNGGLKDEDFGSIYIPIHIWLGSEDRMVTKEESLAVSDRVQNATFRILESVPHPLEKLDMEFLAKEIIMALR
jgi:pimeloyl-ACP methyl ester carboxylesterase